MPNVHSMPTSEEIQRLQRADRIRALWRQLEGRLKTERAELVHAHQIAQALKSDADGANKLKATRDAIIAHAQFAQSRWQSLLTMEGLREADWESDMTRTERAQRDALVAVPKPVDEKSERPRAQGPAQAKSRPSTPNGVGDPWRPTTPQNGAQLHSQMRILNHQRRTKVMVTANALDEDETNRDAAEDESFIKLIELPSLTSTQTEYLESVGFFDDVKKLTAAMKDDFRRQMQREKKALEVHATRSGMTHIEYQTRYKQLECDVFAPLHEQVNQKIQEMFRSCIAELNYIQKGAAQEFRINREEAQYLHKIDFAEEEEFIRLVDYMAMFKKLMSDNQSWWDNMQRPDLTRAQLLYAYREHLKHVEERSRKWEEETTKKAMAKMKQTLAQYVLDPDFANRKAEKATQSKAANNSPPHSTFMTSRIWCVALPDRVCF